MYQNTAYWTSIEPNRLAVWPPRNATDMASPVGVRLGRGEVGRGGCCRAGLVGGHG